MSNSIKLYTQDNCPYCTIMKDKLDSWGLNYETVNISYDRDAKLFLKENGHKTVPQVYYNGIHLNKVETKDFTQRMIMLELQLHCDGQDWGCESFA